MASKAKLDANKRYLEKQDTFPIRVPKGQKNAIMAYAARKGKSLNSYVTDLIDKDMTENSSIKTEE